MVENRLLFAISKLREACELIDDASDLSTDEDTRDDLSMIHSRISGDLSTLQNIMSEAEAEVAWLVAANCP